MLKLPPFQTIIYKTANGETITATKNNDIITLVGDQKGVRKMSLKEFLSEYVRSRTKLERTPIKDEVKISKD